MAKPACTFCEVNEGLLMDTNLDDGETQIICGSCLAGYALGLAAVVTDGMSAEEAETYAASLDAIAAHDVRSPRRQPKARRPRPAVSVAPQPPLDGSESGTDGHVDLPEPCEQCGATSATGDTEKLACDGCGRVIAWADGRPADPVQPALFGTPEEAAEFAIIDAPGSEAQ